VSKKRAGKPDKSVSFGRKRRGYYWDRRWKKEKRVGKSGYVYIFKSGYDDLYKIGMSGNWESRLRELKIANPQIKCIVSHRVGDMRSVESELHRIFKHKRIEREWFSLNQDDISRAERLMLSRQPDLSSCLVGKSNTDQDEIAPEANDSGNSLGMESPGSSQ